MSEPYTTTTYQGDGDPDLSNYVFVMEPPLRFVKVRDVKDPHRGTKGSAGIDVFVPNDLTIEQLLEIPQNRNILELDGKFHIPSHGRILIPSGLHFEIPDGFALIAYNKSGIATKKGLDIGASVCDSDYEGEVHISLTNSSNDGVKISRGDKIVQFLLIPVDHRELKEEPSLEELYKFRQSERGDGGFGSTGTT